MARSHTQVKHERATDCHPDASPAPSKPSVLNFDHPQVPLSKALRSKDAATPSPILLDGPLPSPGSSQPTKPPRPPNSFMLYRSELNRRVKAGLIPPTVEHKQQNFSKLAGQCWNLLDSSEKAIYEEAAARVKEEHARKYPGYKFKPRKNLPPRSKGKSQSDTDTDADITIKISQIREKYVGVMGPALVAPRRKRKTTKVRGANNKQDDAYPTQYSPRSDACTPGLSSGASSPESTHSVLATTSEGPSHLNHPRSYFTIVSSIQRPSTASCFEFGESKPVLGYPASFVQPFALCDAAPAPQGLCLTDHLSSLAISSEEALPEVPFPTGTHLPQVPVTQKMEGPVNNYLAGTHPYVPENAHWNGATVSSQYQYDTARPLGLTIGGGFVPSMLDGIPFPMLCGDDGAIYPGSFTPDSFYGA